MERFEIQPVLSSALPDVADFLHRWRETEAKGASLPQRVRESAAHIEKRLRWLLLENPIARQDAPLGYCVRDAAGAMRGLTLCFPAAFRAGEQRLLALGSGSFFVEPAARSLGFYLFKKYLAAPGYSFFFSTTCNANSSELWSKLGGHAIPNSENEYVLPLRLDGLVPGLVAGKTSSKTAAGIARFVGLSANPILRLPGRRAAQTRLTIQPCEDWDKLSALSLQNSTAEHIASDRSVEFLKWRYGSASPLHPCHIYSFRDPHGNEGWFSLGNLIRGAQGQFRGCVLLDVVWPRNHMSFGGIFQEIVRLASAGADAIFLRSQPGLDYRKFNRWALPYRLPAPRAYVKIPKHAPKLALHSLDYDDSDFGAWRFRWTGADNVTKDEELVFK